MNKLSTLIISLLLLLLLLLGCKTDSIITISKLKGKWINNSNEYLEIGDSNSNNNYIGKNVGMMGKYLQLNGDTLSFQNRYTSSEDNYATNRVDRFDFKINLLTDTVISITPISLFANKVFEKDKITLTRQEYATDKTIDFENIIFHTTSCYGHCPVYHLEINKKGITKLHKEVVYKKTKNNRYLVDSLNVGYFSGVIPKSDLELLNHHIQTCNLDRLEFDGDLCCDGVIVTMIIDYNGKRKYLKDMFPPKIASNLIDNLYQICEESILTKTDTEFKLEQ